MASSFSKLIKALKQFPGVGSKSAERIAFYLLETDREEVEELIHSLQNFLQKTILCETCGLISEQSPCRICSSPKRDRSIICVVKNIQEAIHIERSRSYFGHYHILGGLLSPLSQIYEKDLKIDSLLKRIIEFPIREIIFALEQSTEADVTIELIREKIDNLKKPNAPSPLSLAYSRMAVGIPMGTGLEYIDGSTLKQSLERRYPLSRNKL